MSIVLSILHVIGWILLIVILIVLFALLLFLFCPVRYLVEGEILEDKWIKAKVHWLLHLLGIKISYRNNSICGEFFVFGMKKTFSMDLTKKEEAEEIRDKFAENLRDDAHEDDLIEDEVVEEAEAASIISKIKGIIERIQEVYGKVKKILADEKNQKAVSHIKKEIIYLIKLFFPKKSRIDAVFSTGSPDTTGQLFGVLACFPNFYHKDWKLLPDFESDEVYFKGSFMGKGRIYGCQIVGIILRILFDKNCRRLYTIINRFLKWIKKDQKSEVK